MRKFIFISLLVLTVFGCEDWKDQYSDKLAEEPDKDAPGVPTVTNIVPIKGGVKIYFTPPADADFLGIKAVYDLNETHKNQGTFVSASGDSVSVDHITLAGFSGLGEEAIPVTLYAVDRSGNLSEGVSRTFDPLPSPVYDILSSLTTKDGPAGITVHWENPDQMDIAILISLYDTIKQSWEPVAPMYFAQTPVVTRTIKGIPVDDITADGTYIYYPKTYRFEFIDDYENFYFVKEAVHTPVEERFISPFNEDGTVRRKLFETGKDQAGQPETGWKYRGDCGGGATGFDASFSQENSNDASFWWDNSAASGNSYFTLPTEFSDLPAPYPPYYITIDMGTTAIYSTFSVIIQPREPLGSASMMTDFEIWATNDVRTLTSFPGLGVNKQLASMRYWTSWDSIYTNIIHGNYLEEPNRYPGPGKKLEINGTDTTVVEADYWEKDWDKLADCVVELPSGLPLDANAIPEEGLSAEDKAALLGGFEFDLTQDGEPKAYRYIRIKVKGTSSGDARSRVDMLAFYGRYPN
ncbi:MAG: DUF4959 domain-containing protein [Dysgonamonadaceae bacterium]|jgi:hypothetical protein|nr:DUF4959 domain-containing protein [Dysgonamonadaceae bacterium]